MACRMLYMRRHASIYANGDTTEDTKNAWYLCMPRRRAGWCAHCIAELWGRPGVRREDVVLAAMAAPPSPLSYHGRIGNGGWQQRRLAWGRRYQVLERPLIKSRRALCHCRRAEWAFASARWPNMDPSRVTPTSQRHAMRGSSFLRIHHHDRNGKTGKNSSAAAWGL